MSTWIAAFVAVAAIAATYFFCVRPAKNGHCGGAGQGGETDRELAQLREELRVLRAQDALDSGRVPDTRYPSEDS